MIGHRLIWKQLLSTPVKEGKSPQTPILGARGRRASSCLQGWFLRYLLSNPSISTCLQKGQQRNALAETQEEVARILTKATCIIILVPGIAQIKPASAPLPMLFPQPEPPFLHFLLSTETSHSPACASPSRKPSLTPHPALSVPLHCLGFPS